MSIFISGGVYTTCVERLLFSLRNGDISYRLRRELRIIEVTISSYAG